MGSCRFRRFRKPAVDFREDRVTIRGGVELRMGSQGMGDTDIDELLPMALEQLEDEISPSAPAYVNMLCGLGPLLWLQTFSVEDDWVGRGRMWDVLDVDGEVIPRVELTPGFRPSGFRNEVLYGAQTDVLGVERLVTVSWEEARKFGNPESLCEIESWTRTNVGKVESDA